MGGGEAERNSNEPSSGKGGFLPVGNQLIVPRWWHAFRLPQNMGESRSDSDRVCPALDRLLAGVVELPTKMASPTGFEPVF